MLYSSTIVKMFQTMNTCMFRDYVYHFENDNNNIFRDYRASQ